MTSSGNGSISRDRFDIRAFDELDLSSLPPEGAVLQACRRSSDAPRSRMFGYGISNVRGSVILPVRAEAAAVSGLHRNTLSSLVPERPGKLRGVVRRLLRPVAGACPMPMQPLQPAWCRRAPACSKMADIAFSHEIGEHLP